jgi:hypothetical protein
MARPRVSANRRQAAAPTCYNQTDPLPTGYDGRDQRARTAFRAAAARCSGVRRFARVAPPFKPPRRPRSMTLGSLPSSSRSSTWPVAKLTHYPLPADLGRSLRSPPDPDDAVQVLFSFRWRGFPVNYGNYPHSPSAGRDRVHRMRASGFRHRHMPRVRCFDRALYSLDAFGLGGRRRSVKRG